MLNDEQKKFLLNLLAQLQINPASPEAAKTVELVQGIIKELMVKEKE